MTKGDLPRELLASTLAPEADLSETLRWGIAHACAAPSELNSQPWRFSVVMTAEGTEATVELLLDESRRLDAIDPDGREARLACGAALLNLRLALRGAELGTRVVTCPDRARPELLARLTVKGTASEPVADRLLRLAIRDRSTHRGAFIPGLVQDDVVDQLVAEAAYEGAVVVVIRAADRGAMDDLTAEAEQQLWLEPAYRREVAAWSRPNGSRRTDGVPGFAHDLVGWRSWLQPTLIRSGRVESPDIEDVRAIEGAPLLLVVGSASDSPDALVRAGAGMQRLLLSARTQGLAASYLNAALHVPELRRELGRLVELDHPQVVLRVGYAAPDRPTSRRHESAVLDLQMPPPP